MNSRLQPLSKDQSLIVFLNTIVNSKWESNSTVPGTLFQSVDLKQKRLFKIIMLIAQSISADLATKKGFIKFIYLKKLKLWNFSIWNTSESLKHWYFEIRIQDKLCLI